MSRIASAELQTAIYQALSASTALTDLVGSNVFDAPPEGELPETYVLIGDERVTDRSSVTSQSYVHQLVVSVVSNKSGFLKAKQVAEEICTAMAVGNISLSTNLLCDMSFVSARSRKGPIAQRRQIELTFRAYVDIA